MKDTVQKGSAGNYLIGELLGEGGFGTTYRAVRESDDTQVVVKYLQMHRVPDWKSVDLFHREAKVLQTLSHPRIPSYIDHGPVSESQEPGDDPLFIVQAFVEGRTLDALIPVKPRFEEAWVLGIVLDVLDVLDYLHTRVPPVIHRDIKPSNIILDASGRAHLIDFGAVRAALSDSGSTTAGTFGYAAPEQFVGRANASSDLYALGMTALAALTGREPESLDYLGNRIDVDAACGAGRIDARFKRALKRMTEPNPDDRAQSASEVRALLADGSPGGALETTVHTDARDVQLWYEARDRLDRCEPFKGSALTDTMPVMRASFDPGGRWAVAHGPLPLRCDLVRLSDFKLFNLDVQDESFSGFSQENTLVVLDRRESRALFYDLAAGVSQPHSVATSVFEGDFGSFDLEVRPDPEGQLVAVWSTFEQDSIRLIDRTGAIVQKLRLDEMGDETKGLEASIDLNALEVEDVSFTPDSVWMVVTTHQGLLAFGRDGSSRYFDAQKVAFSPDGRHEAFYRGNRVEVRRVVDGYLGDGPIVWARDVFGLQSMTWNADSRTLVVSQIPAHESRSYLVFHDIDSPDPSGYIGSPRVGGLDTILKFGASRDGRRILIHGVGHWGLHARESTLGLGVFSAGDWRYTGTLTYQITPEKPARGVAVLQADGLSSSEESGDGQALARSILAGQTLELEDDKRLALDDLRTRLRFVSELFRRGLLDIDENVSRLVTESTGLTHLLPAALMRLNQSGGAHFGPSNQRVTVDRLVRALDEIREMSPGERDLVFEDMIQALKAGSIFKEAALPPRPNFGGESDSDASDSLMPRGARVEMANHEEHVTEPPVIVFVVAVVGVFLISIFAGIAFLLF